MHIVLYNSFKLSVLADFYCFKEITAVFCWPYYFFYTLVLRNTFVTTAKIIPQANIEVSPSWRYTYTYQSTKFNLIKAGSSSWKLFLLRYSPLQLWHLEKTRLQFSKQSGCKCLLLYPLNVGELTSHVGKKIWIFRSFIKFLSSLWVPKNLGSK